MLYPPRAVEAYASFRNDEQAMLVARQALKSGEMVKIPSCARDAIDFLFDQLLQGNSVVLEVTTSTAQKRNQVRDFLEKAEHYAADARDRADATLSQAYATMALAVSNL